MSDVEQAEASKSRLPSPGCLFAITSLVVVASVGGWIGWRAHRQRELLEYFEKLGAVETQPSKPVWLHEVVLSIAGSEHAQGFTDITAIDMGSPMITDADLQHLRGLTYLQELSLGGEQIGPGIQYLSGLSNLHRLDLSATNITDTDLQYLSGLNNLEQLDLTLTDVTDAGLQHLRSLENLKYLSLWGTQIIDGGLRHLTFFPDLRGLELGNTQVTDDGLRHLSGLTNLKHLWIARTQITDDGVNSIQRQLPQLDVREDYP